MPKASRAARRLSAEPVPTSKSRESEAAIINYQLSKSLGGNSKSLETQSKSLENDGSRLLDFFSTELVSFSTELKLFSMGSVFVKSTFPDFISTLKFLRSPLDFVKSALVFPVSARYRIMFLSADKITSAIGLRHTPGQYVFIVKFDYSIITYMESHRI